MTARIAIVIVLGCAAVAHADQPTNRPEAFEVDLDRPPPGQAELGFDAGGPLRGVWAASVQVGYLDRPFELHTSQIQIYPVEHRETLGLGGAFAVTPTLILDAYLPLEHQVGDRYVGLGDDRPLDRFAIGDARIGGRLRLADRGRAQLFARGELTVPTGDDHDFAGEARYTGAWMLIARFMPTDHLVIAATAGVHFRAREVQVADRLLGDELTGAAGITYELPAMPGLWCTANHVRVTAEVHGILGNDVADKRGPSPVEARVGMVSDIRPWLAIAGRVGKGLDDQIGAPRFRALLEVVYRR